MLICNFKQVYKKYPTLRLKCASQLKYSGLPHKVIRPAAACQSYITGQGGLRLGRMNETTMLIEFYYAQARA